MGSEVISIQTASRQDDVITRGLHAGSAFGHIELTYHDVTVFAIPEFKSLEVLEKKILH